MVFLKLPGFHRVARRASALAASVFAGVALAQTSEYEDRLVENLSIIDSWRSCLMQYPRQQDVPPIGSLPELQRAVAMTYLALNDSHVSEHEPRLEDEFQRMVIAGFPNHYQTLGERLDVAEAMVRAGRPADPVAYDFTVARIADFLSRQCFALPLLIYEGVTPYHALYEHTRAVFALATGEADPPPDLRSLSWPALSESDLGDTAVMSLADKREIEAQERARQQRALRAEIEASNAARDAAIARENAAVSAAAQEELEQELARAKALVEAGGDAGAGQGIEDPKSGSPFLMLLVIAALFAAMYRFREPVLARISQVPMFASAANRLKVLLADPAARRSQETGEEL
ncbi:MAG: hypothetical protein AAGG55_05055 [Pseudomonadota bacterium]